MAIRSRFRGGNYSGRSDDPHGVTGNDNWMAMPPSRPEGPISIGSSPAPMPEKSAKQQKREQKSLKKINSPKEMEKSAVRGKIYDRARADEQRPTGVAVGTARAYIEGGVAGVQARDKKVAEKTNSVAPSTPFEHEQMGKSELAQAKNNDRQRYS